LAESSDTSARGRRGPGRPFAKGVSGNPGGRPKEAVHVKELAREYTVQAVTTLAEIMCDPEAPAAARARSAEALLNRGWGTPESTANVNVSTDPTTEQLIQIILGDPELAAIIGAKLHTPVETKH
jgi:hypothetical protein